MRPKANRIDPKADETGQNETYWPGDARIMPGTKNEKNVKIGDGNLVEETRLPEMLNDGKLYTDPNSNAR